MTQYTYRSAVTGEFVTREYAEANPSTTIAFSNAHQEYAMSDIEAKLNSIYDKAMIGGDLGIALQATVQLQYLANFGANYSSGFSYSGGTTTTGEAPGAESQAPGAEKAP